MRIGNKFIFGCALAMSGCASYHSQLVDRDYCNTAWETENLKGIPVTLKVPTHIDVTVTAESWFKSGQPFCTQNGCQLVTHRVEDALVETEKIFTVDPKRPAAGSAKSEINFSGQYIDSMKSEVNDQTIQEIGLAIQRINQAGGLGALFRPANEATNPAAPPTDKLEGTKLVHLDRVCASRRFDLSDPDVQLQIQCFLDESINGHCE